MGQNAGKGRLSLFTHIRAFWVAGLLLALIDIPDFGALRRIADSVEETAETTPGDGSKTGAAGKPSGAHGVPTGPVSLGPRWRLDSRR